MDTLHTIAATTGVGMPGVAATLVAMAATALVMRSSGGKGELPKPPSKERQAELAVLRKGRAPAVRVIENPTFFQKVIGASVISMFASMYIVAPLWLMSSIYLVVMHPMEWWAWIVIGPVVLSAIMPPIASKKLIV
jgi:hypothetical protein